MATTEQAKNRREKLIKAKRCGTCGKRNRNGRPTCNSCIERRREWDKLYRTRTAVVNGMTVDALLRSLEPTESQPVEYSTRVGRCGGGYRVLYHSDE